MGPKPTKLQLETLTKLAQPGVVVHEWDRIRGPWQANIRYPSSDPNKSGKRESLRHDVLDKFRTWGWLKPVGEHDWRGGDYAITDEGREVVAKGEVRK